MKTTYLARIRSSSSYPVFRRMVEFITAAFFLTGCVIMSAAITAAISMLYAAYSAENGVTAIDWSLSILTILIGIVIGLLPIFAGRLVKELLLMIADAVDSITDLNSKYENA